MDIICVGMLQNISDRTEMHSLHLNKVRSTTRSIFDTMCMTYGWVLIGHTSDTVTAVFFEMLRFAMLVSVNSSCNDFYTAVRVAPPAVNQTKCEVRPQGTNIVIRYLQFLYSRTALIV